MKPWTPDGHQKQDFTGLTIQASQFQLPDGTVICPGGDDMTTINITIEKIEIKNSRFIGVKEAECDDDEDENEDEESE